MAGEQDGNVTAPVPFFFRGLLAASKKPPPLAVVVYFSRLPASSFILTRPKIVFAAFCSLAATCNVREL